MRVKLTDQLCRQAPPKAGRVELWDTMLSGLCLRITANGVRTFSMIRRDPVTGKQRRISLSPRYPVLSLAEARKQARDLMMQWQAGADLPPLAQPAVTIEALIEEWYKRDQAQNRTRDTARRNVRRGLAAFLDKPGDSVKRFHVRQIINEIGDNSGPVQARNVRTPMRRFFQWCLENDHLEINPVVGVKPPKSNGERTRVLDDDELRKVWLATDDMDWPFGPIFKLLILTSQRKQEVGNLAWSELKLDKAEWHLPLARAKNKRDHIIPLSQQVVAILEALPHHANTDLVFPNSLRKSNWDWNNAKKLALKLSRTTDWTIHDLRRSSATFMRELGIDPAVIDAIQNHVEANRVRRTYQRYEYDKEKRAALQKWADHVDYIVTGKPPTKEVEAAMATVSAMKYRRAS